MSLTRTAECQAEKYGLAVMNIKAIGIPETAAAALTETFHTSFSELIARRPQELKDAYELLERSQMDKIYDQFQTQDSGCTDVQCAVEFGKMLSVQRIVISSVGQVEDTYTVTVRLVDVESSRVIRSVSRKHGGKLSGVIDLLPLMGYEVLTGVKPNYPSSIVHQETNTPPTIPTSPLSKPQKDNGQIGSYISPYDMMGMKFVSIPVGSFQMGSTNGDADERPVHLVSLSGFDMSAYEITQGSYKEVMRTNPSKNTGDDNLPVENVSWWDAIKFCNALSVKAGLQRCYNENTGDCDFSKNGFRLPTEAEWEYACRAGTTTKYYTGDEESDLEQAGWYRNNKNKKSETHPVGKKIPNAWGLFDMHGNVWEWCNDWYASYSSRDSNNPLGISNELNRVIRGGSCTNFADYSRSANRNNTTPGSRYGYVGFRIVRRP
jgi:formylglycine-generating enzyme required for sulfatase activity